MNNRHRRVAKLKEQERLAKVKRGEKLGEAMAYLYINKSEINAALEHTFTSISDMFSTMASDVIAAVKGR